MTTIKKMRFTGEEVDQLKAELDGYIWVVIDARRGLLIAGDEYVADMRDQLLLRRSKLEDIFAFGLNLCDGRIDYLTAINRRNPVVKANGAIPADRRERIEGLTCYFFGEIAPHLVRATRRNNTVVKR